MEEERMGRSGSREQAGPSPEELRVAVRRLNARAWGIAGGLVCGIGLFLATVILVLRGGEVVGPHLGLLSVYFPGYSVTLLGSLIGFVYAFVLGYILGRFVGWVYNWMVEVGS